MNLNQSSKKTDFIKFAAESYMGVGGNPAELFAESADWLYDCYEKTGDAVCLEAAVQIVKVYMDLGFLYVERKLSFDRILSAAGMDVSDAFPTRMYPAHTIKRRKSSVREMLGFWPKASEEINDVEKTVDDILLKLKNIEYGCFYYGKRKNEIDFELLIVDERAYLMDLNKKKIYVFEKLTGRPEKND